MDNTWLFQQWLVSNSTVLGFLDLRYRTQQYMLDNNVQTTIQLIGKLYRKYCTQKLKKNWPTNNQNEVTVFNYHMGLSQISEPGISIVAFLVHRFIHSSLQQCI